MSGCKKIITYSQSLKQFNETRVIMRIDLVRCLSGLVSLDRDRGSMGVRARDHQHSIASQAMITCDDIAR